MEKEINKKQNKKIKILSAVIKLSLLVIILIGIPLYVYFFQHQLIEQFSSVEAVETFLKEYETQGFLVYIGAQIMQIIICIVPGQPLQFAAGYSFGFIIGLLLSIIGAAFGTTIAFFLAKLLGKDAMHIIFSEDKINKAMNHLESKRGVIIVFLIYLLPGAPKDICTYAAGISEMKFKPFLILSLIGRTPGIIGSLLIGYYIVHGYYGPAIIVGIIAIVLFAFGLIFRSKIINVFNKAYDKFMEMM